MNERAPGAAQVEAALGALLPGGVAAVVWGARPDDPDAPPLEPVEREAIRRAVPARRLEFARGRYCARKALARLGCGGAPAPGDGSEGPLVSIPVGSERAPVWPGGFTGSITHCEGLVAAVATRTTTLRAVGIDAEPARTLPAEVRRMVLRKGEELVVRMTLAPPLDAVVFSAKEAIHKAVHPLTGVWLEFLDVELKLDLVQGRFRARRVAGGGGSADDARAERAVASLEGRFSVEGGFVLSVALLAP